MSRHGCNGNPAIALLLSFALCFAWAQVLRAPVFAFCPLPFDFCLRSFDGSPLLPASDLARNDPVVPAVVQLLAIGPGKSGKNRECSATGFLVNEQGYILTNAHVVEDAGRCLAGGPEAKIMAKFAALDSRSATAVSCDLVGVDDLHDLALMKTERPPPAGEEYPFVLLDLGEVAVGTSVAVTGHPAFAWQPHTQTGKVVRREFLRLSKKSAERSEVIVVDIPLKMGNSGSPVYLQEGGGVVGIVERQNTASRSETVAVSIRYAIELLDRHGVRWHRGMW